MIANKKYAKKSKIYFFDGDQCYKENKKRTSIGKVGLG